MRLGLILALTTLSMSACANPSPRASPEIFDEQSGNTILVVPKPLVFARERLDVAAHARDYATLVAVEIDQSGKYSEYLLLYRWSTVDRRMSPPPDLESDRNPAGRQPGGRGHLDFQGAGWDRK